MKIEELRNEVKNIWRDKENKNLEIDLNYGKGSDSYIISLDFGKYNLFDENMEEIVNSYNSLDELINSFEENELNSIEDIEEIDK